MSLMFWARLPNAKSNGVKGTLIDCQNSLQIRLDQNGILILNVTQVRTTVVKKVINQTFASTIFNYSLFPNNIWLYQQWNHYAFTLVSSKLRVYINSFLLAEFTLPLSTINTISNQCFAGNSQNLSDPSEIEMRHLLFLNQALNTSADIKLKA